MADDRDDDRLARIAALHRAARLERAETLRRLLQSLLRRRGNAAAWPPKGRPALGGDC
jgi:hypothetical protein